MEGEGRVRGGREGGRGQGCGQPHTQLTPSRTHQKKVLVPSSYTPSLVGVASSSSGGWAAVVLLRLSDMVSCTDIRAPSLQLTREDNAADHCIPSDSCFEPGGDD